MMLDIHDRFIINFVMTQLSVLCILFINRTSHLKSYNLTHFNSECNQNVEWMEVWHCKIIKTMSVLFVFQHYVTNNFFADASVYKSALYKKKHKRVSDISKFGKFSCLYTVGNILISFLAIWVDIPFISWNINTVSLSFLVTFYYRNERLFWKWNLRLTVP